MTTLIAEDVLLLLLDDSGAWTADNRKPALAGAVLAELSLAGAIEIETEGGLWKRTRVVVTDPAKVTDPVLAGALTQIGSKPRSPQELVSRLGRDLPEALCSRLVERGVLHREDSKVLGLFGRTRWPEADARHEDELRARLRRVLVDGEDPDQRSGTVIAVLSAIGVAHKVLDRGPMSVKEFKKRAEQIAEAGWATEAVRKVLEAANVAIVAAVTAATVGATTAGS